MASVELTDLMVAWLTPAPGRALLYRGDDGELIGS
jgi:hypothetical protein